MTQHLYWTPKPKQSLRLPDVLRDEYRGNNSYRLTSIEYLNGVWTLLKGEEKVAVERLINCLEDGNEVIFEIE